VFAPAGATFEMIRRTLVKIAVRVAPMIDAARAAASPHFNHKTRSDCRSDCRRGALFRPPRTTYDDGWRTRRRIVSDWRLAEAPGATGRTHDHLDTTDGLSAVVPFLSLDRLQKLYSRHYIIPPMPPWLWSG
jgi:hypothetical protein